MSCMQVLVDLNSVTVAQGQINRKFSVATVLVMNMLAISFSLVL